MEDEFQVRADRRDGILRRVETIHTRLEGLEKRERSRASPYSGQLERLQEARRHAAAAKAAAVQALVHSVEAFRSAAEAHDRVASQHDKAAASGIDVAEHKQQAAFHRAAARADRQQADRAQSLLPGAELAHSDGDGTRARRD